MVEEGSAVRVWFSAGPDTLAVPQVAGLPRNQAEEAIRNAGLEVGEVTEENSATVAQDHVISSNPEQGQAVEEGATVDLVVSTGQVELPNLVGQPQADAEAALAELRLSSSITAEETADAEPGTVIRQSPEPGPVNQGQRVELVVAQEPEAEMVAVPDLVNKDAEQVEEELGSWNLNGRPTTDSSDTVCPNIVISQEPPAGTQVEVGSDVNYVVSTGPGQDCGDEGNEGNEGNEGGGNGGGNGRGNDGGIEDLLGGGDS
jgi:serine/threonine-protein kinase